MPIEPQMGMRKIVGRPVLGRHAASCQGGALLFPRSSDELYVRCEEVHVGVECMMLLLCYKIQNPDKLFMLRGNHECGPISRIYGFYDEVNPDLSK